MTDVKPGQVWADNDPRSEGRTLRIDAVDGRAAYCTILTNADVVQAKIDDWHARGKTGPSPWAQDRRGKTTSISLARLKPTSSGYRLVPDAPEES
jgi:hypothetical protein